MLDSFNAGNAWIESILKRIYDDNPIREIPTPEDIKAFPYEERRLLLAATGLRAEAYPKNWTGESVAGYSDSADKAPKRVEVFFSWEEKLTQP
jgi:hypothetical protein